MIKKTAPIRVRYAPSPTGPANLGSVRTTFFNWLFARHAGGTFILRIEDTDKERSKKEYEDNILETLLWLGLDYDEFYRQSERKSRHAEKLNTLLESGKAYYCFCSPEELDAEREAQISAGLSPKYSGKCRAISFQEARRRAENEKHVIRLRVPEKKVSFQDIIRGKVTFDSSLIGDIIIAKNLEEPLYNFAVVVDDYDMGITHVIRGEDHISNTPKQILIAEALGCEPLVFGHIPLVLGANKKKLSKRDFAKSVIDLKNEGYVPDAILNFLVLLGWHPEKDREVLSRNEMIAEFSLDRVQKSGAILNLEKLDWLNSNYIKKLSDSAFLDAIKSFIPPQWEEKESRDILRRAALKIRERISTFGAIQKEIEFFFVLPEYPKDLLVWKKSSPQETKKHLDSIANIISKIDAKKFKEKEVEQALLPYAEQAGRGDVLWPLRVALTGKQMSPGPFECAEILGKTETEERIKIAIQKLS